MIVNRLLLVFFLSFFLLGSAQDCSLLLSGHYAGKNLYVKNPFVNKKEGFCVKSLIVNDSIIPFISASTFEINLHKFSLSDGDSLEIRINHKCGCLPQILNPVHHYPKRLQFLWNGVFGDSLLMFTVSEKESESGKYVLQQFRWNKWNSFDSIASCRPNDTCTYTFSLSRHLHPGTNKFRVYRPGATVSSGTFEIFVPEAEETNLEQKITNGPISLPHKTWYELWDEYGKRIRFGYGDTIDISSLYKGTFYLNYDNKSGRKIVMKE